MNTCFDRADLVVAAHDADGQTFRLGLDLHPGTARRELELLRLPPDFMQVLEGAMVVHSPGSD
jgi:hypothetical protein